MPQVKDIVSKFALDSNSTIDENSSVHQALYRMATLNSGAMIVLHHNSISGIFSERDYARKVVLNNRNSETTRVSEVMTKNVVYVHMDSDLDECMRIMTQSQIRHLPVLEGGYLRDFISINDIVSRIVADKDFHISQLTQYITGAHGCQNRLWHSE